MRSVIPLKDQDDWIATDHEDVYYNSEDDKWDRGEYKLATFLADHLPGWSVVITMGPDRPYDVQYTILQEVEVVHLDCYAAAMVVYGDDVPWRKQHPAVEHGEAMLLEIAEGSKTHADGFNIQES